MSNLISLGAVADVPEGRGLTVRREGKAFAVFKLDGEIHVLNGECPHRGAALAEGCVENGRVFCPLHGWEFELRSGECVTNPAKPVRSYLVTIADGQVWVDAATEAV